MKEYHQSVLETTKLTQKIKKVSKKTHLCVDTVICLWYYECVLNDTTRNEVM